MASPDTILLVGISVRALAESARRAGYPVVALDYFGDRDLRQLCPGLSLKRDFEQRYSAEAIVAAARDLPTAAVVYGASFENHPELVAALSARRELLGNPPEVLRQVRDPALLARSLAAIGVAMPRTLAPGTATSDSSVRWLRKPLRSGGGHSIVRWPVNTPIDEQHYLQEEHLGPLCSAAFVADGRRATLVSISRQLVGRSAFGAHGFRYCGNLLPLPCTDNHRTLIAELRAIIDHLTQSFALRGVNGLDFIIAAGEVRPLELNPRFSASLELAERAYGLPIFALHVRACRGDLPLFALEHARTTAYHAKSILYARHDLTLGDTSNWLADDVRDIPETGEQIARGQPICTIFAQGPSWRTCYRRLVSIANRRWESFEG